ncbi:MAG: L-threonylcarbamoyladenylate synthase [Oscillospiraceae bacterium]|nr:L-threonylcarbamoyladenylate synthase [Oscillospiraceae bacterium]
MDFLSNNRLIRMNEVGDIREVIEYTASVLLMDGVVLIPTDTVYGLICMPTSAKAIDLIFRMKQRPLNRHFPIIVADQIQAEYELPLIWNNAARTLASAFWPGALTLACGIRENDIEWLNGRVEVGVRVPNYPLVQGLAKKLGPLLMTSANQHGDKTPNSIEGALMSLVFHPSLVIDGGQLSGAPSTLVNTNLPIPVIERAGIIPNSEIERILQNAGRKDVAFN